MEGPSGLSVSGAARPGPVESVGRSVIGIEPNVPDRSSMLQLPRIFAAKRVLHNHSRESRNVRNAPVFSRSRRNRRLAKGCLFPWLDNSRRPYSKTRSIVPPRKSISYSIVTIGGRV